MSDSEPIAAAAPVKRGRGRPRKDPSAPPAPKKVAAAAALDSVSNGGGALPKKRGRKPGKQILSR